MSDDIKIACLICGSIVSIALIIAGGLLLSQWMDVTQVKNITLYLPGAH